MSPDRDKHPDRSVAWRAGREAAEAGIPLKQSALSKLAVGCAQYLDFIDGYDSIEPQKRSAKSASAH